MTAAEVINGLTQSEYTRLLSCLAGAIRTQRKYITIISAEVISETRTRYRVKRAGAYNHYLIDEIGYKPFVVYSNMGLII